MKNTMKNGIKPPTHPTLARLRARAQALGSTATSARGIARYLRTTQDPKIRPWPDKNPRMKTSQLRRSHRPTLTQEEREIRRAQHDGRFRARYLRTLRAERDRLMMQPARDADAVSEWLSDRDARARLAHVAGIAKRVSGVVWSFARPALAWVHTLAIGEPTARKCGAWLDMRAKDANVRPTAQWSRLHYKRPETKWKNGRPVSYTRAERTNFVRSFAVVRDDAGSAIEWVVTERSGTLSAPDGYRWGIDQHGLRLLSLSHGGDYHPSGREIAFESAGLVEKLEGNNRTRDFERTRIAAEAAEVEGVFVCLADSVRGGNCVAGSREWARQHDLDPDRHYPAPELLRMANGSDRRRVRLAISAARRRHQTEQERGVALLEQITETRAAIARADGPEVRQA